MARLYRAEQPVSSKFDRKAKQIAQAYQQKEREPERDRDYQFAYPFGGPRDGAEVAPGERKICEALRDERQRERRECCQEKAMLTAPPKHFGNECENSKCARVRQKPRARLIWPEPAHTNAFNGWRFENTNAMATVTPHVGESGGGRRSEARENCDTKKGVNRWFAIPEYDLINPEKPERRHIHRPTRKLVHSGVQAGNGKNEWQSGKEHAEQQTLYRERDAREQANGQHIEKDALQRDQGEEHEQSSEQRRDENAGNMPASAVAVTADHHRGDHHAGR